MIPDYLTVANPVDNGAQFLVTNPIEDRRRVFDLICADENVDVVVVGLTGALGRLTDRFAEDIVSFIDELPKPVIVTWNSFKTDEAGFRTLVDAGVPLFRSFRNCFSALNSFAEYQRAAPSTSEPGVPRVAPRRGASDRARRGSTAGEANERPEAVAGNRPRARRLLESSGVPLAGDTVATSLRGGGPRSRLVRVPGRHEARLSRRRPQVRRRARAPRRRLARRGPVRLPGADRDAPERIEAGAPDRGSTGPAAADRRHGDDRRAVAPTRCSARCCSSEPGECSPRFFETWPCGRCRSTGATSRRWWRRSAVLGTACRRTGTAQGLILKALVDVALSVAKLATACGDRLVELDLNPVVVREGRRRGRGRLARGAQGARG